MKNKKWATRFSLKVFSFLEKINPILLNVIILIVVFGFCTILETTFLGRTKYHDQKQIWVILTFFFSYWSIKQVINFMNFIVMKLKPKPVYTVVKIGKGGQKENIFETKNLGLAKNMAIHFHQKDPERIFSYLDYAVLRKKDDEYVFFTTGRWNVSA